jgi:nucleoside-diphosphate-sugar epimerase
MASDYLPFRPKRVLVTGVTGLVGRGVAKTLVGGGTEVVGACRTTVRPEARVLGVRYVEVGEIGLETRWDDALRDVDAVVHAAAHAHVMSPSARDHAAYHRVNVAGTRVLARAAEAHGVGRFVFVSSIKVNGEATLRGPFTSDDHPAPRDAFARCKLAGEEAIRDSLSRSQWVIVRPPLVYGAGMRGNFARMAHLVSTGLPLPFGAIDNRRSLVGVDNLSDLIALLISHPRAVGRVWLASDGEDVSTPELVSAIANVIGLPARLWSAPVWLLRVLGAVAGRHSEMRRLTESLYLDIDQTRDMLGWKPKIALRDGLARALEGYRVSV